MNNIHSKMPQNISQNFPYLSARYSKLLTVLTINIFQNAILTSLLPVIIITGPHNNNEKALPFLTSLSKSFKL